MWVWSSLGREHPHPLQRKCQPTPVFLLGKSRGQRSLASYSPWGHRIKHGWAHTHIVQTTLWYNRFACCIYTWKGNKEFNTWQINLGHKLYFCLQLRKHRWIVSFDLRWVIWMITLAQRIALSMLGNTKKEIICWIQHFYPSTLSYSESEKVVLQIMDRHLTRLKQG